MKKLAWNGEMAAGAKMEVFWRMDGDDGDDDWLASLSPRRIIPSGGCIAKI